MAAACCRRVLTQAGLSVAARDTGRARVPAIMLGEGTQGLIADVFEKTGLFDGLHKISKRVVAWGPAGDARALAHAAVVISEEELAVRLGSGLNAEDGENGPSIWTIHAAPPLPAPAWERRFGSRIATAFPVELQPHSDSSACWIESAEAGWLFLVPNSAHSAWLLAVGDNPENVLEQSRLVAKQIGALGPAKGRFPAYPRIAEPLSGPGWMACGAAALGFDPLCGDGTGHAVREGLLAGAVIRAAAAGEPALALSAHYGNRLLAGFARHLALCADFYRSGHSGPWWDAELELLRQGAEWCQTEMRNAAPFRYRLNGFDLEAAFAR